MSHNLGCALMWVGRHGQAEELLRAALDLKESPLSRFFPAGVLLEGHEDRREALENLRAAAGDARQLLARVRSMFYENPMLEGVRRDPEFLAALRAGPTV